MQTTEEYFSHPDTPAAGSPVGVLIVRLLDKNPGVGFEKARNQAHEFLRRAAGKRKYRVPVVRSPEEEERRREALREAFQPVLKAA